MLQQVARLEPLEKTVSALLPAFYAMNNNLMATQKLKTMLLILRDQIRMLESRQCILRSTDLEKMKMQMAEKDSRMRELELENEK